MASGVYGVIMSAILAPHSISVGASGAILGQLGASAFLQLLLGTTPLVDNFQHFFGFIMGLVFAMGILIQPSYLRSGWPPMAAKCQQQLSQVVSASVAYLLFVAGLLALYGEWDAYRICPWCSRISCLPFPWGCDPLRHGDEDGGCWWDCSTCSMGGLAAQASWRGSK